MSYKREEVNGTSPLDLKKINDNFRNIWSKLFGDINFVDTDNELQNKILTQWISAQGSSNFDSSYPLEVRFFIPPNVKKIVSSNFNFNVGAYRFDSGINEGGGGIVDAPINLEIGEVQGASTSSTPSTEFTSHGNFGTITLNMSTQSGYAVAETGGTGRHYHDINFNNTQSNIEISQTMHSHNISHTHTVSVPSHTHTGNSKVTITEHTHPQKAGVVLTSELPKNVKFIINEIEVIDIGNGANSKTNIDVTAYLKIGQWNIVKMSTENFGNGNIFGTIEVLIKS